MFVYFVFTESQLTSLEDLGFRKEDCRRALVQCKGESNLEILLSADVTLSFHSYSDLSIICLSINEGL